MLPIDFAYPAFAAVLFLMGLSMGAFAAPNRAAVMNSLPEHDRGAGGGMNQTFQNSAQVLSIGIFFTLMILGLSGSLPHALATGLVAHGVPAKTAAQVGNLPPVSVLFAAFLGYNPMNVVHGRASAGNDLRPFCDRKRSSRACVRHMTMRSCDEPSFSVKYKWPDSAGR